MKNVKRKGFTLVELLIVIVIIGILAGAMMMLMGSSTDKAEATKVISDLRTMKGGVLQYYADHGSLPATSTSDAEALEEYVDKQLDSGYCMVSGDTDEKTFFVGVQVPSAGALEKLYSTARNEKTDIYYDNPSGFSADTSNNLSEMTAEPDFEDGYFAFSQAK